MNLLNTEYVSKIGNVTVKKVLHCSVVTVEGGRATVCMSRDGQRRADRNSDGTYFLFDRIGPHSWFPAMTAAKHVCGPMTEKNAFLFLGGWTLHL